MEQLNSEQIDVSAQTAVAEVDKGERISEISLGKFKDVNALLNAYNSLQSEFTKRCQKIKELEGAKDDKTTVPSSSERENSAPQTETDINILEQRKTEILKEYLKGVIGARTSAIVMDKSGVGVSTPITKPKTFEEVGKLAKEILNNK